jgi:hypothetical protein
MNVKLKRKNEMAKPPKHKEAEDEVENTIEELKRKHEEAGVEEPTEVAENGDEDDDTDDEDLTPEQIDEQTEKEDQEDKKDPAA